MIKKLHSNKNLPDALKRIEALPNVSNIEVFEDKITFITWKLITYEELVERLIRRKYSVSDELALIRQQVSKPDEFEEYNNYVEKCKSDAKAMIQERIEAIGK